MFEEINGLPVHILVVHAVVVFVPLAALLTVLSAVWPAARRRLGIVTPLVALVALGSVKVAEEAGEWLQARVPATPLINQHVDLGGSLLPYVIALFAVAVLAWGLPTLLTRRTGRAPAPWVGVVVAVLAIAVAGVGTFQVYRVGESGSKAVWTGSFCPTPLTAENTCQASG
jgi:hypothetical protein